MDLFGYIYFEILRLQLTVIIKVFLNSLKNRGNWQTHKVFSVDQYISLFVFMYSL